MKKLEKFRGSQFLTFFSEFTSKLRSRVLMRPNLHSQTLPLGAVWSRLRWRLKSSPARSWRRWVLSMPRALSGSRKRWSLPSAGPRVRGTPSPRGPERAVNILVFLQVLISPPRGDACSDLIPDTLLNLKTLLFLSILLTHWPNSIRGPQNFTNSYLEFAFQILYLVLIYSSLSFIIVCPNY